MPKKLDPKVAEKLMLKAGLKPLEPYKNALTKWKCRCLNCKNIVNPKFNSVQQGQSGCITCGYRNRVIPHKIKSKDAIKRLKKANLTPLEAYRSAVLPWKSKCLICGSICSPKLNAINSGQGGCIKCGYLKAAESNRIPKEQAVKILLSYGYKALVKYESSKTRWKSKCLKCSRVVYPRLAMLQYGQGGCGYCSNRIADLDEINRLFKKNKLRSLQSKPLSMKDGWKCQCLRCKRKIKVYVTNLYRGSDPCKYCSGKAVDPKSAALLMKKSGLKVLAPYQDQKTKWKSQCTKCKNIVYPMYESIRSGQGGCMYCAEKGMDMNVPSYLYLISHESYGALKIGIGNVLKNKNSDRLLSHKRNNWDLYRTWNFKTGADAYFVEQAILNILRLEMGIPPYLSKEQMPQRGETETVDVEMISILELEKIIKKVIKGYS
jgi:Zn ribbon nucleic-acid-binding protein